MILILYGDASGWRGFSSPTSGPVHSHLSPTTASDLDSMRRHRDESCPSCHFFGPVTRQGSLNLGERTAMTAPPLKVYSLKLHVHDIKKASQWIPVLRDKKRLSIRRNDPFIKPVCELKILNESDPVGKKIKLFCTEEILCWKAYKKVHRHCKH